MTLFGLSVFADISYGGILALISIYFFSFALKGMFGLGSMPPLVVFGSWVLDPHHAVSLAVLASVCSQVQFVREGVRYGDWRVTRLLLLAYIPATILGVWIFGTLETAWLTVVVGISLVGIILLEGSSFLRRYDDTIQNHKTRWGLVMSAVSGVIGGVVGAGGVILISTYVKMVCKDVRVLRATVLLLGSFFISWRAAVYAVNGFVPLTVLVECGILLPVIFVGGYAGSKLFGILPKERFAFAFRLFLILASLNLVIKGLMAAL